jgi:hypothetical protein
MKEKIIDFSNGVFTYEQERLQIEQEELSLELEEGKMARGSFVISSCDERRIKGILYERVPGLKLKNHSFFARAVRVEYECRPQKLRPGESITGHIWIESNAGEYDLPVTIRIRAQKQEEEPEELALPPLQEPVKQEQALLTGKGRSEEWIKYRKQEKALARMLLWTEKEGRNACKPEEAASEYRKAVDELLELDPDSPVYPLLDAWVMLREERREEAGWILRKYERTRLFQQRDTKTRAIFLYVNSLFRQDPEVTASNVAQLQKLYLKQPENWMLTWFLLKLDVRLQDPEKKRTRYTMLERQFRAGTRSRLLYQEAWNLLKDDMALFTKLDAFTLQTFSWASSHGFLTEEIAGIIAGQSGRLKKWTPLSARLLKACYQIRPSKETAGAVCGIYIRGHRTDPDAFIWYEKGVELDSKITNLYEYFMYALPEDYPQLLPRPVILYFTYHNTLTNRQKTAFYCNLVRYGALNDPEYDGHRRQLQEFLLKQLKERRINESLAWLYGRCLLVETLEKDMLEALADLLFLRKLTCQEKRIRQVEVSYEQLEETFVVPLVQGSALIPIYTPGASICLVDEQGRRYRKTVPYEMKRILIEPKFLQTCIHQLKDHLGLNLYLLDGKGDHRLQPENLDVAMRLLSDDRVRESYQQKLKLEFLEYERKHHRLDKMDKRFRISDTDSLSRSAQAAYIECFILLKQDEEAYSLLQETGCREVDPKLLLQLIQRLLIDETVPREELRPYARQVFEKGIYTEQIAGLIAEEEGGNTEELLTLWKAAQSFGLHLPHLEEQLVVQALFTQRHLTEVFPVYQAMDDRGGDRTLCCAWLNYMSWLDFVKGQEVPEGLFEQLEHHLLWEDGLAEVASLSYLRQLSVLLLLTSAQKKLVKKLLKELGIKGRRFAFMQKLYPCLEKNDRPDDQTVVEYRCNPNHKVMLHYVLEYHGKKTFEYVTEQLFPVCGGVFTRSFVLFYGERLSWFFTEEKEDGTTVSTVGKTLENRENHTEGDSRYQRLCRMQRAMDFKQERQLKRMMTEYEELTELSEEQFRRK